MPYSDDIADAFKAWETRLRGWNVYSYPVELEPPLVPMSAYLPPETSTVDDGRQHTPLSYLVDAISKPATSNEAQINTNDFGDQEIDDSPERYDGDNESLVTFTLALPQDYIGSLITYQQLLLSLRYAKHPIGFEIVGSSNGIYIQYSVRDSDSEQFRSQLRAHLPEATVSEQTDALEDVFPSPHTVMVDFALEQEVMLPLKRNDLKHDPLNSLVGSMENLAENEAAVFQVLLTKTNHPWDKAFDASLLDTQEKPLFLDSQNLISGMKEKAQSSMFACVVRLFVAAEDNDRTWEIARGVGGGLAQFDASGKNNLMPLSNDSYEDSDHYFDFRDRTTHRSGMLLSLDELVGLVHYPDAIVQSQKLHRQRVKTKAAPDLSLGHDYVLGENEYRGTKNEVALSEDQRTRHMYVVGASGTGKSTLLLNCIKQDIENSQGLCVLDPHGDLIDQALAFIPEDRIKDVILIDPTDEEYPIGLNIFDAHSNLEKTLLASDLTAVFERLSTSWGDQMSTVLGQGVLAMLESSKGGTLHDLRRFLIEQDFRNEFLEHVQDQEVVYYWQKQFPLLSGRPQASVLTRLDTFLRPKPIRYMVAQRKSAIDFAKVMDEGKILLAKLSHGGIGEENSYLLGAILASKIQQTAMARQSIPEEHRRAFWLYIDEFQNFLTPSISQTLSGARKYSLGMILAHQELTQLSLANKSVAASVIANPYTRICFRMGDRDAKTLSEGFSEFDSKDLQNLGIGEAIGRIEQAKYDFSLSTYPLPEIDQTKSEKQIEKIRAASRKKYATPRVEVEKLLSGARNIQSTDTAKEIPDEPQAPKRWKPSKHGKGGEAHTKLQKEVQNIAHDLGFGAEIEKHIGEGKHVDVEIFGGGQRIAVEISITTSPEHETENIQKCIDVGYRSILIVSNAKKKLSVIKRHAQETFDTGALEAIQFLSPKEVYAYLQPIAKNISSSETIRGYEVGTEWVELEEKDRKIKEAVMARVLTGKT